MIIDEIQDGSDVLIKAAGIISCERADTHGDKLNNFANIAAVWNGILIASGAIPARPLDGHDVANLMEGLKIARRYLGEFNPDDYVDGAGYAGCAFEVRKGR